MSKLFSNCARTVERLHTGVLQLERAGRELELEPLAGREWYELMAKKLLPQLTNDAFLVVAVVGGTNIGKSVIFNHLAGCRASSTSPAASGTKHPVLLVPPGFAESHDLSKIFIGFEMHEWTESDAALEERDEHCLFWRTSHETPSNLLVLDTPDIDSDATVNWERADNIRRCADVLIAVLTQQKYNDAAVKQFFRKAADDDKAVIVVFNQCLLPEDEQYWPTWLDTFCTETNIRPELTYIAPNDRQSAEGNTLPFYQRHWPRQGPAEPSHSIHSLMDDLSQLMFDEIKVRTLRGSLKHLIGDQGLPAYLIEVEQHSSEFRSASALLCEHSLADIDDWPAIPNAALVGEIRSWWQSQRQGWSAKVHGFYNTIGAGLAWPFRIASEHLRGPRTPPIDLYRQQEWDTILATVEKVYQKLNWFSELGNELLQPRLDRLMAGKSRTELIQQLQSAHAEIGLEDELRDTVATNLKTFREDSPQFYGFLKNLDSIAAVVRPMTSIALFVTGFGPAGNAAAHLATDTAMQSMIHVAGDVAGGTVAAAVGETAISNTASSGAGYLEAKFRDLHTEFTRRRADWLAEMLKQHLLGDLPDQLQRAASIPDSAAFHDAISAIEELESQLAQEQPCSNSLD